MLKLSGNVLLQQPKAAQAEHPVSKACTFGFAAALAELPADDALLNAVCSKASAVCGSFRTLEEYCVHLG